MSYYFLHQLKRRGKHTVAAGPLASVSDKEACGGSQSSPFKSYCRVLPPRSFREKGECPPGPKWQQGLAAVFSG